jgi:CheY-like chemotaxis protein
VAAGVKSPEGRVQILVVDDELGVRRLICRMLAQGGYGTCEAADGAEALASLRAGLAVDLVLSDVAMPQLNGVQLLEVLSVSHPDLPVLLMSGYAVEDLVARGIAAPCGIVMKPFHAGAPARRSALVLVRMERAARRLGSSLRRPRRGGSRERRELLA